MSNENKVEETTEKNDELEEESNEESEDKTEEETEDESNDESEESDDAANELERLRKENKTLTIQKDKWRTKAENVKKTNEQVSNIPEKQQILEFSRLAAKGYTDEDIDLLIDIKSLKGFKTLKEAEETQIFKLTLKEREEIEKRKKASLGASASSGKSSKPTTKEDLKKQWLGR
jgi:hypothetical protein